MAVGVPVLKLVWPPAVGLAIAKGGVHLNGMRLTVIVMMAALPIGSNALIFAQRYRTLEAETTASTVFSTLAFVLIAPAWLSVLSWLHPSEDHPPLAGRLLGGTPAFREKCAA